MRTANEIVTDYMGRATGTLIISDAEGLKTDDVLRKNRIKSVIISENIESLSDISLDGCNYLRTVKILGKIKEIPDYFFKNCYNLKEAELPEGLERIGELAFGSCIKLKKVNIPDTVKEIGYGAFAGALFFKPLIISESSDKKERILKSEDCEFKIKDNVLYTVDESTLVQAFSNIKWFSNDISGAFIPSVLRLPDGLKTISAQAFANVEVETVLMPDTVEIVERDAFRCCGLKYIELPDSIVRLGESCFLGCFNLNKLIFGNSLTVISSHLCSGCKKLETVKFPGLLREIGSRAFENCHEIKEIRLPETLKEIGECAFANVEKAGAVSIPKTVEKTGENIFTKVDELTVYDSIPDIWKLSDFGSGTLITVKSAESDEIVYKLFTVFNVAKGVSRENVNVQVKADGKFDFEAYDSIFKYMETDESRLELSLSRLVYPYELGDEAKTLYTAYLRGVDYSSEKTGNIIYQMITRYGLNVLEVLSEIGIFNESLLERLIEKAGDDEKLYEVMWIMNYKNDRMQL